MDHVLAGASFNLVGTVAAVNRIVPGFPEEAIIACTTIDDVVTRAAPERVVATQAQKGVVAGRAVDDVVRIGTGVGRHAAIPSPAGHMMRAC
ncbi:MAG: hypothetical protein CMO29_11275 [Tistrella sp.]|nr:hypothetical protein [Tistrella sp.]